MSHNRGPTITGQRKPSPASPPQEDVFEELEAWSFPPAQSERYHERLERPETSVSPTSLGVDDSFTAIPRRRTTQRRMDDHDGSRNFEDGSPELQERGLVAGIARILHQSHHSDEIEHPENKNPSHKITNSNHRMPRPSLIRRASGMSEDSDLDPDDPSVTGAGENRIDDDKLLVRDARGSLTSLDEKEYMHREQELVQREIQSLVDRRNFILKLAKALMTFGAPSHRLESQLIATAKVLSVPCQFIHFPGVVLASFDDPVTRTSETHIVKATTRLMLGRLHTVHKVYRSVVHSEIGVAEGTNHLRDLLKSKPVYSIPVRCMIAFLCASIICPLAFGGSIVDASVAGTAGLCLAFLQLHAVRKSVMFANIFEITIAMFVAFVARGLSSWQPEWFCYSAISTAGVVLILPGFAVLCSALELASKNIISGAARLVWAITYTLFLGFSLTMGSDFYFLLDGSARRRRQLAAASLTNIVQMNGTLAPDQEYLGTFNSLLQQYGGDLDGSWNFVNQTQKVSHLYKYQIVGCYREPGWPWYRRPFPYWSLFILVPMYSLCSSSWNLQPLKSKQTIVMVTISCLSYAARKTLQHLIGARNEVVSAAGAFVVGILGNVYGRVFKGTAFTCMVTGVLFLVPSGIAAAGGLAENYRGSDGDQYTSSIEIGIKMLQVAIGTTVGLLISGLVVYSFGHRKKTALFAF